MSRERPLVTVVTPTFNRADLLGETIEGVLAQEYPRIEYLVLDDGSTDGTPAVLDRFGDRVRRIRHENIGQARTVNLGLELARGDYVCVISDDDPQPPGLFGPLVEALEADPGAVLAYPDWEMIDAEGRTMRTVTTLELDPVALIAGFCCLPGPGTLIRRSLVGTVGGWEPGYRFGPDLDWYLRAALVGRFLRVPRVLARWRHHPRSATAGRGGETAAQELVAIAEGFFRRPDLPPRVLAVRGETMRNAYMCAALRIETPHGPASRFHCVDRLLDAPATGRVERPRSTDRAAVEGWLHREVAVRDEEVRRLHREVAARDEEVSRLHREVAARDEEVGRLHREVAARDEELKRAKAVQAARDAGLGRPLR